MQCLDWRRCAQFSRSGCRLFSVGRWPMGVCCSKSLLLQKRFLLPLSAIIVLTVLRPKRLEEPVVLSEAEKASLADCVGSKQCVVDGRVEAFRRALGFSENQLQRCSDLLEESATLEGYLQRCSAVAESDLSSISDLPQTARQLASSNSCSQICFC